MNSVPPRPRETRADLLNIHDPGLTPVGRDEARLFSTLYKYHIRPTLIVTSPLRRCLQTTTIAFGPIIRSGKIRAIAYPGIQECSNKPCDTGTPLDILREEFPDIEFLDELFPEDLWPRDRSVQLEKAGTIYDDHPDRLLERAIKFRKWLREVDDVEIIVVTHGDFAHFLWHKWAGNPGKSGTAGFQLSNGVAIPVTLAGSGQPEGGFCECDLLIRPSPSYDLKEETVADLFDIVRDCGVFTPVHLR